MKVAGFCFGLLILGWMTGCATLSDPQYRTHPDHEYPGPQRPLEELAIVQNDETVFLGSYWRGMVALLPGEQTLYFSFYRSVPGGYYHSLKPFPLTHTLEAGHTYQVVGYEGGPPGIREVPANASLNELQSLISGGSFTPSLVDVTTASNVWAYYSMNLPEFHQCQAVKRMTDQAQLAEVARQNPKPAVRELAVEKLDDPDLLRRLLENEIEARVRQAAERRLKALVPAK